MDESRCSRIGMPVQCISITSGISLVLQFIEGPIETLCSVGQLATIFGCFLQQKVVRGFSLKGAITIGVRQTHYQVSCCIGFRRLGHPSIPLHSTPTLLKTSESHSSFEGNSFRPIPMEWLMYSTGHLGNIIETFAARILNKDVKPCEEKKWALSMSHFQQRHTFGWNCICKFKINETKTWELFC